MATPFAANVTVESGYDVKNNIDTASLFDANTGTQSGAHIAFPGSPNVDFPGNVDPNWEYGNTTDSMRAAITDYIRMRLGDGIVDVELDKEHYEMGITQSLIKYRQRAGNSVEESYCHLQLMPETQEYILPKEIQQVRQIFRRSVGSRTGNGTGGTVFEPFNLAYTNTYLLSSTNMGGLLTYELFAQYQELVGKMFGSFINFTYHPQSRKLIIHQRPRGEESVMLQVYNTKPDFVIIDDVYSGQWIKDYALANCKMMLGQARSKFGQIAGPQGGTQLNGTALITEAQTEMEKLTDDLMKLVPGGSGYTWITG
jgi:hypothetical protein